MSSAIEELFGCGINLSRGSGIGMTETQKLQAACQAMPVLDTTNPKDLIGVKKVPLGLLPAAGKIYGALAMEFGAYRAGPKGEGYKEYNWRANKVKLSIYLDAIERHLLALRDGEDFAEDSKVHHLGHIIAGASIVADALEGGQLIDDRPMKGPAAKVLERLKK